MNNVKKNITKFESYKYASKLMDEAKRSKNLPFCISAIAIAESIIADRCLSFLCYKEKDFIKEQCEQKSITLPSAFSKKKVNLINAYSTFTSKEIMNDLKNIASKRGG